MRSDEARLIELETRLAYQEDLLQSLNQLAIEQRDKLDSLEATCRFLLQRLRDMSQPAADPSAGHEIPPHY